MENGPLASKIHNTSRGLVVTLANERCEECGRKLKRRVAFWISDSNSSLLPLELAFPGTHTYTHIF